MKPVYYFSDDPPFSKRWADWLNTQGYDPILYNPLQPQAVEVLLLLTPLLIDNKWISIENVWKRHFENISPSVKIIQAGIHEIQSRPNYLHLYAFPDNFSALVADSVSVTTWEPYPIGGEDLGELLSIYFSGHGTEGIVEWLNKVIRSLESIKYRLQIGESANELQAWLVHPTIRYNQDAAVLLGRWNHFKSYFNALPDKTFIKILEKEIIKTDSLPILMASENDFEQKVRDSIEAFKKIIQLLEPIIRLKSD